MRRGLCGVYGEVAISVVEDTLRHRQSDGTVAARAFAAGPFRVRAVNVHERGFSDWVTAPASWMPSRRVSLTSDTGTY